ncbi:transketolase [Candidatus Gottesmanbacteria bacterium]|nr:transketolase [Candidatus Gottesmanbacteria bacterium]
MDLPEIEKINNALRYWILRITHAAGSGHPTTSFSSVELMSMLFFRYFSFDFSRPDASENDRIIFSKGHASALYYSLFHLAGIISEKELLGYRTFESALEGHPTFRFPYAEAATGSLGQGLAIGIGEAWEIRYRSKMKDQRSKIIDNQNSTSVAASFESLVSSPSVYVLLGDAELSEGSNWEAAAFAGNNKIDNVVAIVDANGFGQFAPTAVGSDVEVYARRFESFGWATIVVDGHDLHQIDIAYEKVKIHKGSPIAIIAKTVKGKGVGYYEGKNGFHNKMLPEEELKSALEKFGAGIEGVKEVVKMPETKSIQQTVNISERQPKSIGLSPYAKGEKFASKQGVADALVSLGKVNNRVVVLDGDMANSTGSDLFAKAFPDRFIEVSIAEQTMAGLAVGLSRRGMLPVLATFSVFFTRCFDQLRMAPLSDASMLLHGSYSGVSLGKDGPSQMGLEDIAMMRTIFGSTVVCPSDAASAWKLTEQLIGQKGVSYIRTVREPTEILYASEDEFPIGGSKVFYPSHQRSSASTHKRNVLICAIGITVHEALKAQKMLAEKNIQVTVMDCYSIKPFDTKTLLMLVKEADQLVIVEDHYPEGGLGEVIFSSLFEASPKTSFARPGLAKLKNNAVTGSLAVTHLAVRSEPRSGKPEELLAFEKIDYGAIVGSVI